MAVILPVNDKMPQFGDDVFLAPNATVIGDVEMGRQCSVWFNAVIRGDVNSIRMGDKVNVQDGAVIHCTFEKTKAIIGDRVSIGHNAIVHGCEIHDDVLIGMGAIVMDNAVIESGSIVAAGAVITEGTRVRAGELFAGVPARFVKQVPGHLRTGEIERIANNYVRYSAWFK